MDQYQGSEENPADLKAAREIGKLYDQLLIDNKHLNIDEYRKDLNIFFSRLLFLYYADDAEIFEKALESGSDCLITGKACSEGGNSTVWMFIAIGIAALIYLVYLLVKHRDGPTVSFIIASIVIFF